MRIKVRNLGALRQAEFNLGQLTIICGGNNTGKTYATYALYGFLDTWREMTHVALDPAVIDALLKDGVAHIDLKPYQKRAKDILDQACKSYTQRLPGIFSANPDNFRNSAFQIDIDQQALLAREFQHRVQAANTELFSLMKEKDHDDLVVSLLVDAGRVKVPTEAIKDVIGNAIAELLFGERFPKPFIASAGSSAT